MTKLQDVIQRGTLAARPAATAVPNGTLYFDTTNSILYRSSGSAWESVEGAGGLSDQGTVTYLDFTTAAAPANPAAGKIRVYSKTGDTLAQRTSGGTETVFGSGGGGGAANLPLDANAASSIGSGDSFAGTTLDAGWSDFGTALSVRDRSVDGALILGNSAALGAGVFRGIMRTFAPAGDFTVWTKIHYIRKPGAYHGAVLALGDSTLANRVQMYVYGTGPNGTDSYVYEKFGTGAASLASGNIDASPLWTPYNHYPLWIGIRRVGTAVSAGICTNGVEITWHTTTTTIAFTVDKIGLLLNSHTNADPPRSIFDYIATSG